MEYYYIPNAPLKDGESVDNEEGFSRGAKQAVAGALGAGATGVPSKFVRDIVWEDLSNTLGKEFNEIRNNPELRAQEMDNLIKTYNNFVDQTGNKVERFIDMPGTNRWAAGTTEDGTDVVYWDSTAPHAAVMAHELGHIDMNHVNPITNPLAGLQQSGLGRMSGKMAPGLGLAGGALGSLKYGAKGGVAGTALGALLGSGNFAYELGGASGRAMDYLPEEVDKDDAYGDLFRAGMTYGMAGPGAALVSGLGASGAVAASRNPGVQRFAGQLLGSLKRA